MNDHSTVTGQFSFASYDDVLKYEPGSFTIKCDGIIIDMVAEFDTNEGWLRYYLTNDEGRPYLRKDGSGAEDRILRGVITAEGVLSQSV